MLFVRKEYLRQSIKRNKGVLRRRSGQVEWVMGMFFVLFIGILLTTLLQVEAYRASSLYLEDALAASNLASAVVDLEEYGTSHVIVIDNPLEAYARYCTAIQGNLQLDEQWEGVNRTLLSGKVTVENYSVYNVRNGMVTVSAIDSTGQLTTWQGSLGTVKAPNNIVIVSTSVYSELSFPVKGIFGVEVNAHKGKLVDIVAQ